MKAAAFGFEMAADFASAAEAMRRGGRPVAGGQSLGPMLNLRLSQPEFLVGLGNLKVLSSVSEDSSHVEIGARVTHAQIEDGLSPDFGGGVLQRIAAGIAYRAVRNRGTIGGSLCHADPAADWVTTLMALRAEVLIEWPAGARAVLVRDFVLGAFRTALGNGEILRAVRVPKLRRGERFGYFKACRKPGEFAHAMAAVVQGPGVRRVVMGAMGGAPLCVEGEVDVDSALQGHAPAMDEIDRQMHLVAVRRAFEKLQF